VRPGPPLAEHNSATAVDHGGVGEGRKVAGPVVYLFSWLARPLRHLRQRGTPGPRLGRRARRPGPAGLRQDRRQRTASSRFPRRLRRPRHRPPL